jgi:CRP-like cAMP-binding protein
LGTVVRFRPGQKLVRPNEASDTTFLLKEGVFVSETLWPGLRSAVLALHYAGDVLPLAALPQTASSAAVAATQAEVLRLSGAASLPEAGALGGYVQASLLDQQARMAIHVALITTLDASQRVASLLAEFALRLGRQSGRGFAFDVPLSRNGMADYLGLNADTLSRIVSNLKSSGVVEQPGRHRFIIRDWKAFFALSPLNGSIDALHRPARAP